MKELSTGFEMLQRSMPQTVFRMLYVDRTVFLFRFKVVPLRGFCTLNIIYYLHVYHHHYFCESISKILIDTSLRTSSLVRLKKNRSSAALTSTLKFGV
jgi:hypothetical protein